MAQLQILTDDIQRHDQGVIPPDRADDRQEHADRTAADALRNGEGKACGFLFLAPVRGCADGIGRGVTLAINAHRICIGFLALLLRCQLLLLLTGLKFLLSGFALGFLLAQLLGSGLIFGPKAARLNVINQTGRTVQQADGVGFRRVRWKAEHIAGGGRKKRGIIRTLGGCNAGLLTPSGADIHGLSVAAQIAQPAHDPGDVPLPDLKATTAGRCRRAGQRFIQQIRY